MTDPNQQTPPETQTPATPAWYGDAPEAKAYVEAKAWKTPADAIASYQNLEKLQRTPASRTLVLPETEDAPEWEGIHERLGRPKTSAEYKFEGFAPVDGQPDLIQGEDGFANVAHRLGLTQKQAGELYKWYAPKAEAQGTLEAEQRAESNTAALEKVKTAWGAAFEPNVGIAKQAVAQLGIDAESLEKIEDALGTEWLLTTFHRIGQSFGETQRPPDGSNVPENRAGFGLSPAEAEIKLQELLRDEAFSKRYFGGDAAAAERVAKLTQAIAGNALVRPNSVIASR